MLEKMVGINMEDYHLDTQLGIDFLQSKIEEWGTDIKAVVVDGLSNMTTGDENSARQGTATPHALLVIITMIY